MVLTYYEELANVSHVLAFLQINLWGELKMGPLSINSVVMEKKKSLNDLFFIFAVNPV